MADKKYVYAIGRRKTATAQVRLFAGAGASVINGKPMNEYVHRSDLFAVLLAPLKTLGVQDKYHFQVTVEGSGEHSQAEAIRLGIARALVLENATARKSLKDEGFLKRDSRTVERKKPGLHKARKASQWSKR
ncbi:MAG: 30S ribosomal protein S9 [Candidatus Gracilibacteria bacterium]|nr:30S ribosomal protein S9 [Candidatus Gracilibacteria bacterium]